jgi:hypothetical protein
MSCFELYQVTPQGKRGEVVVRGDMKTIGSYVRNSNLVPHHDPRDPFAVYYTRPLGTPIYRVAFRMDV